ncbi:MAG: hypothetical protein LIO94_08045 [Clostridiales bacterium]|nr:hypothetical protein [Clostridiales bacterium]
MKIKEITLSFLMLLCVFVLGMSFVPGTVYHASASTQDGLVKAENGKYYYYEDGKKVKDTLMTVTESDGTKSIYYFNSKGAAVVNKLKTVTVNGVKYRYYFGKNGKAYTNKWKKVTTSSGKTYRYYFGSNGRAYTDTVKTINGAKYGFGSNSRMLTGVQVLSYKFYYFKASGKLDSSKTSALRKASAYGKDITALNTLLKKYGVTLKKTEDLGKGCSEYLTDWLYVYKDSAAFTVYASTLDDGLGTVIVTGVESGDAS